MYRILLYGFDIFYVIEKLYFINIQMYYKIIQYIVNKFFLKIKYLYN